MKQVPCWENGTSQQFLGTINLFLLPTLFISFLFSNFPFLKILVRFFRTFELNKALQINIYI